MDRFFIPFLLQYLIDLAFSDALAPIYTLFTVLFYFVSTFGGPGKVQNVSYSIHSHNDRVRNNIAYFFGVSNLV